MKQSDCPSKKASTTLILALCVVRLTVKPQWGSVATVCFLMVECCGAYQWLTRVSHLDAARIRSARQQCPHVNKVARDLPVGAPIPRLILSSVFRLAALPRLPPEIPALQDRFLLLLTAGMLATIRQTGHNSCSVSTFPRLDLEPADCEFLSPPCCMALPADTQGRAEMILQERFFSSNRHVVPRMTTNDRSQEP